MWSEQDHVQLFFVERRERLRDGKLNACALRLCMCRVYMCVNFFFLRVSFMLQDAHGRAPGEDFHETVATPLKVAVGAALR